MATMREIANSLRAATGAPAPEGNGFGARPDIPGFTGITDSAGALDPRYSLSNVASNMPELQKMLGGLNLDTTALNKLQSYSMDPSTSPWAAMLLQKQGLDEGTAMDRAAAASQSGTATGMSRLASAGGLRSGAAERLAKFGARDLNMARSGVARQGMVDRASINANDEQQKLATLQQIPGMQVQALQPGLQKASLWGQLANAESNRAQDTAKFNAGNLIGNQNALNQYNLGVYGEKMKGYAAEKTAEGQENSGKK